MTKIKISFDFDETLDREDVQKYCLYLQSKDIEIFVTTSRCDEKYLPQSSNKDMFNLCDKLNIPRNNIILCNYYDKYETIGDKGFLWHLDDSQDEISLLNIYTNIKGIDVTKDGWREECESYLK